MVDELKNLANSDKLEVTLFRGDYSDEEGSRKWILTFGIFYDIIILPRVLDKSELWERLL